eukprot:TRINITY_DN904_c0_g1_i2.p1 TRINITY_DN904_c0_g1~~TRINITY_DN904_c0_g1_i2.p1  ORF type:complete len:214 (+),score=27.65 TRINITY_DN904_c0_g1_i2:209-850(+)
MNQVLAVCLIAFVIAVSGENTINFNFDGMIPGDSCCESGGESSDKSYFEGIDLEGQLISAAITDEDSSSKAFSDALARRFAAAVGGHAALTPVSFAEFPAPMLNGEPSGFRFNLGLSSTTLRESRKEFFQYGPAYLTTKIGLFVAENSAYNTVQDFVDDVNARIVFGTGSTAEPLARSLVGESRLVADPDTSNGTSRTIFLRYSNSIEQYRVF